MPVDILLLLLGLDFSKLLDASSSTSWTHQICRDAGVTESEALQLAEDQTSAMGGGSG